VKGGSFRVPFFLTVRFKKEAIMNKFLKKLTKQLWETAQILTAVLAIAVLVSGLFGPNVPFFGGIMQNIQGVIQVLGSEGLGVIIAVMILTNIWNRKS
jgi:hypothetical protein